MEKRGLEVKKNTMMFVEKQRAREHGIECEDACRDTEIYGNRENEDFEGLCRETKS